MSFFPDQPVSLDDEFVRAAAFREPTGEVRARRAREIASAHQRRTPWRAPAQVANVRRGSSGRLRRHGRDVTRAGAAVALAIGVLMLVQLSGTAGRVPDPLNAWATGAPTVPVPADASDTPLGRPAPAPSGEGGFTYLIEHGGRPVTFDPCRPLHYVVRLQGAPPAAAQLVAAATAQLSAATGLRLVDDGPTDEPPDVDRSPHQRARYGDRWVPVLIAWSTAEEDDALAGSVGGYASPVALDPDGRGLRLLTGQVVVDAEHTDPAATLTILLHELGHLVGLGHVADPSDTMHAKSVTAPAYTPGALRGLHTLGQGRCIG